MEQQVHLKMLENHFMVLLQILKELTVTSIKVFMVQENSHSLKHNRPGLQQKQLQLHLVNTLHHQLILVVF
jgi:hypothetical protein